MALFDHPVPVGRQYSATVVCSKETSHGINLSRNMIEPVSEFLKPAFLFAFAGVCLFFAGHGN